MKKDPGPKKKNTDTEETPGAEETKYVEPYVEPEAIDSREPEDLDSDEENI